MTKKRHRRSRKEPVQTHGPRTTSRDRSLKHLSEPEALGHPSVRKRQLAAYLVLVGAVLSGVLLRGAGISQKHKLTHDETISYLAATGHQGEYERITRDQAPPFGAWVEASEWKRFARTDEAFCFRTTAADLARYDIHPPLYFWLLHIWCLVFGVHIWTGPTLNVLFAVLSTVALFSLARYVLRDALAAAMVAFIWSVSPNVIQTGMVARQYDLLALCAILFVWRVVRCTSPENPCGLKQLALLALSTAAGLLTHYHFPILILGGGMWAFWRLARNHRRRLAGMCGAVAVGIVVLAAFHPGFVGSAQRGRKQAQPINSELVTHRLNQVLTCYTGFFVDSTSFSAEHRRAAEFAVLAGVAVMMFMLVGSWAFARVGRRRPQDDGWLAGLYIVYFLLWGAGTNILLYLTFITPNHGMAAKHPAIVWPFYAFLPVLALGTIRKARFVPAILLSFGLLLAGVHSVRAGNRKEALVVDPSPLLNQAQRLIIDNVRRGNLPRVVWLCPDDLLVYAADKRYLLKHKDTWAHEMDFPALYVSLRPKHKKRRGLTPILRTIVERYHVARPSHAFWNVGVAYRIPKRP